jgi:undecaprenyl-diphosphatase
VQSLDWSLFSFVNSLAGRWPALDTVMVIMASYGPLLLAVPLILLWFTGSGETRTAYRQGALRAVIAAVLALLTNQVIGLVYFRPRPFVAHTVHLLVSSARDSSFPSDHATGSWALAWSVRHPPRLISMPMTVLAVLITIARVYVGAHYPSDVIGGALIGIAITFLVERLWPLLLASKAERLVRFATQLPPHGSRS